MTGIADAAAQPAPASHGADPAAGLASRAQRMYAALIDVLIGGVVVVPLGALLLGGVGAFFSHVRPGALADARLMLASWMVYPLVHGYLLATRGQTVGKRVIGIRIVRSDRSRARLGRIMFLRWMSIDLLSLLPTLGTWIYLVDVMFILGKSNRCLHDYLADTVVVRVTAP